MKKILFQKFIKDTLKLFITIAFVLGLIVWVIQAVNFLDFVTEDGHSLYVYFSYSALNFPKIIHRILPFVFFISLFYQILKYEISSKILRIKIKDKKITERRIIFLKKSFIR